MAMAQAKKRSASVTARPESLPGEAVDDSRQLVIPRVNRKKLIVTVRGVTSLITNNMSESTLDAMADKQSKKAKGPRTARDPHAEFLASRYVVDGEKDICGLPASAFKAAMVTAGGRYTDEHMTKLRGTIIVPGDILPIRGSKARMGRDRVVLKSGVTSLAYRAYFDEWEIDVPVLYDADIIEAAQVINILMRAGQSIGVGAWRPDSQRGPGGAHGLFDIVKVARA